MNKITNDLIGQIAGMASCRKKVGRMRSLSLGFGRKIYHDNTKLNDEFYGEWEVGTYYCAWRVIGGGNVLCGSQDPVNSLDELDAEINKIAFGRFVAIKQIGSFDIRIDLDNDISVEIFSTISNKDESFHIFGPNNLAIIFSIGHGWEVGDLNKPWKGKSGSEHPSQSQ